MSTAGRPEREPRSPPAEGSPGVAAISLKLYASLADYLPAAARRTHALRLDLPAGTTVAAVIARQGLPAQQCHLVLVNGVYVAPADRPTRVLGDGDELAIWPPVAGG